MSIAHTLPLKLNALTVDTSYTCFVTSQCASYQYTTLSGVVRVK